MKSRFVWNVTTLLFPLLTLLIFYLATTPFVCVHSCFCLLSFYMIVFILRPKKQSDTFFLLLVEQQKMNGQNKFTLHTLNLSTFLYASMNFVSTGNQIVNCLIVELWRGASYHDNPYVNFHTADSVAATSGIAAALMCTLSSDHRLPLVCLLQLNICPPWLLSREAVSGCCLALVCREVSVPAS